jgi:hypothetical protein
MLFGADSNIYYYIYNILLHNLATDCLPIICLHGNLFTNTLPSNGCTCNNMHVGQYVYLRVFVCAYVWSCLYYIVTWLLGNARVISGFRIWYLDLLDLSVVITIIHFITLRHISQRFYLLSSVFRTALPGWRIFSCLLGSVLNSGLRDSPYSVCKLNLSFMLRSTVSRPVCLGIKHPCGVHDQIFITVWQLRVWWCGEPSLTIGRGTLDHILLYQICDFPFRRLLRLAGSRWRYSTPPPNGIVCKLSQPSP